jgi:HPt (histidine-containing phosphotransfer) domain-containing protein
MGPAEQQVIAEAMNRLWAQYLPQIEDRVRALESAAAAHRDGSLTREQREQATAAAHKLAGVLGTFGLSEGTSLAREAEEFYSGRPEPAVSSDGRPAELASQLRAMIATRK